MLFRPLLRLGVAHRHEALPGTARGAVHPLAVRARGVPVPVQEELPALLAVERLDKVVELCLVAVLILSYLLRGLRVVSAAVDDLLHGDTSF